MTPHERFEAIRNRATAKIARTAFQNRRATMQLVWFRSGEHLVTSLAHGRRWRCICGAYAVSAEGLQHRQKPEPKRQAFLVFAGSKFGRGATARRFFRELNGRSEE